MSISVFTRLLSRHRAALFVRVGTFGLLALCSIGAQGQPPAVDASRPELSGILQELPHGRPIRLESVFLADFGAVHLNAERFRVFAEDAQIWRGPVPGSLPRNVYLRGSVDGFPGSLVVLSLRERGTLGGWVLIDGSYWQLSGRAGIGGLVSEKLDPELAGDPFDCLTDALPGSLGVDMDRLQLAPEPIPAAPAGTFSYTARVAVDTDWEFLDLFGGDETAATDYVGDLFAFASAIYEAEIDTSLYISFLRFWPGTSSDDPWSAGDCTNQLYEFRDYWRANEAGRTRALAHLLSGKRTGCGIAYVGVLCSGNFGYGVSASLRGNFDPAASVPPVWDILVISHEIGHNFNSPHTHCYNGLPDASYPDPVDPCYNENGCYAGSVGLPAGCPGTGQGCGTIMSYCHLRSGGYGNITMTFGGSVLDGSSHLFGAFPERVPERMHSYVQSRATGGCLDPVGSVSTLTVTRSGDGAGTVTSDDGGINCGSDCTETYADGAAPTVNLTATPEPGSTFSGWSGDPDCGDGRVTVSSDLTCIATFDLVQAVLHTLSVSKDGNGSGTVTSDPAGIDCGADCLEDYAEGTEVTLTPTPDAGSTFAGWSGAADCGDGSVTLDDATACTAAFALETRSLTISKGGTGSGTVTSSPAGINCGADCSQDFDYGTVVTLSASPSNGSTFAGWSGDADCSDGSVTLDDARTCTATFTLETRSLSINKAGTGTGTVSSSPAGIDCGPDCVEHYDYGTVVTLSASPSTGSTFAGWSGDADCSDGAVTMEAARSCVANFALQRRTLTVGRSGAGSGRVTSSPTGIDCGSDCSEDYDYGTSVSLTATPLADSSFTGWSGSADCADGSVTMDKAQSCTATFDLLPPDTFSLTISKTGSGLGSIISSPGGIDCGLDCNETYDDGTVVTLIPSPAVGSSFIGWSGHADCADGQVSVTSDKACVAEFALQRFALDVATGGAGSGRVTSSPAGIDCGIDCSEDYDYGTVVTLTPAPDPGSTFAGWSGNADCADGLVTMAAERLCEARFELQSPYIFADGFETGDTSVWSHSTED